MRFLFCDRILALDRGKHGLSTRSVALADEFLTAHYALRPLMPASLTLECIAQLAGWLYIATEDFGINVVLALAQQIEVFRHPRPGETLCLEVWMDYSHRNGATLHGEARIGEETILRAGRLLFASERSKPDEVEKTRAMFAYVSGGFRFDQVEQS